jgi:hypothetical protein
VSEGGSLSSKGSTCQVKGAAARRMWGRVLAASRATCVGGCLNFPDDWVFEIFISLTRLVFVLASFYYRLLELVELTTLATFVQLDKDVTRSLTTLRDGEAPTSRYKDRTSFHWLRSLRGAGNRLAGYTGSVLRSDDPRTGTKD